MLHICFKCRQNVTKAHTLLTYAVSVISVRGFDEFGELVVLGIKIVVFQ